MKPAKRVFFSPLNFLFVFLVLAVGSVFGGENVGLNSLINGQPKNPLRSAWLYPRQKWDAEMAAFRKADMETGAEKGGIVFVGSSSIRLWTTLRADFSGQPVTNRGFGGAQIPDCVEYVDQLVTPYQPSKIVFYCGGNDLAAHHPAEVVAENFAVFVEEARKRVPMVRVAFISIAPNPARWGHVDWVRDANRRIAEYCSCVEGLEFIDVFGAMLGADGKPRPELFREDGLHMNQTGYRLWARLVKPYLNGPEVTVR
jgi:lysophospholipase L1-like esterase